MAITYVRPLSDYLLSDHPVITYLIADEQTAGIAGNGGPFPRHSCAHAVQEQPHGSDKPSVQRVLLTDGPDAPGALCKARCVAGGGDTVGVL
jgi:hypothetical protein